MRNETHTPDGVEVVTRQPATFTVFGHNNPSTPSRVNEVLLDTGKSTYECDVCGYTNDNPRSVIPHMNAHVSHSRMKYTRDEVKTLVRECLTDIRDNGRYGYASRVAATLNARGLRNSSGTPFTPSSVCQVFLAYRDVVRTIARPRKTDKTITATADTVDTVDTPSDQTIDVVTDNMNTSDAASDTFTDDRLNTLLDEVAVRVTAVSDTLHDIKKKSQTAFSEIDSVIELITEMRELRHAADPVLLDKAKKYDAFIALIKSDTQ